MGDRSPDVVLDPELDERLRALGDYHRRCLLYYFLTKDEETATIDELREFELAHIPEAESDDQVTISLYHQWIPKLAEVGFVEFDERSQTVRYSASESLSSLLDLVKDHESR